MAASMILVFNASVERVLDGWTALQIAVQNGFGGAESQEKAKWMVEAITQWFKENDGIQPDELEDFLSEVLSNEFDTVVDDGSLEEVSRSICGFHRLCEQGKGSEVMERVQRLPKAAVQQSARCNEENEDDDEDGEMNGEASNIRQHQHSNTQATSSQPSQQPQQQNADEPMEEDDGWQVVSKGKRK